MRRKYWAAAMLLATAAAVMTMVLSAGRVEEAEQARVARVERGDVEVVSALRGVLGYGGLFTVYAQTPGRVEEVYAVQGQRVTQGQALMRMDAKSAEQAASAWAAQGSPEAVAQEVRQLLEAAIVRAPETATVRRVLAERYMPVAAGTPLAVLSAGGQEIVCMAAEKDARMVRVGMQARLSVDGAEAGKARVEGVGPVTADSATGRPQVEITLVPDAPLALPQGAAVAADVVLTGAWDVPVLPLEAVTDRGTVWWVHDGICTEIPVEIVLSDEKHAWVNLPEGTAVAIGEFEEGQPILEAAP